MSRAPRRAILAADVLDAFERSRSRDPDAPIDGFLSAAMSGLPDPRPYDPDDPGAANEQDVIAAAVRLELQTDRPFDRTAVPALVDELWRITRSRKPRYWVGLLDDGLLAIGQADAGGPTRARRLPAGTVALVVDPSGGLNNESEALELLRVRAKQACDGWSLERMAIEHGMHGRTVEQTAARQGKSRAELYSRGVNKLR